MHDNEDDVISTSTINSKYYNIKELNSLKPDYLSSFGMFHVNMAYPRPTLYRVGHGLS